MKPSIKATYYLNSSIWHSEKDKTLETETESVIARGQQEGSDNEGVWGQILRLNSSNLSTWKEWFLQYGNDTSTHQT